MATQGDGTTDKTRILFIDDEKNILNSLNRLFFEEEYEIMLANSPGEAIEIIKALEVPVIVSDQRMPSMTGVEFFTEARNIQGDSIRIILTGYSDVEAAQKAINKGAVYRFLSKPWDDNELKNTIKQAIEYYRLQKSNQQLFEENLERNTELKSLNENLNLKVRERTKAIMQKNQELHEANSKLSDSFGKIVRVIVEILEVKSRELSSHSKRVAAAARYTAAEMGKSEAEVESIEIAAMLHDIGKISMSEQTITKRENLLSPEEISLWKGHPLTAERILSNIDQLAEVRRIIRHHHENYNGSGYPDGLKGKEIPLGSRIIAVVDSYDKLVNKTYINVDNTRTRALKALRLKMGLELDSEVVSSFINVLHSRKTQKKTRKEIELKPFELKNNMILSRDLYTTRGMMVFPKDKRLDGASIKTILDSERLEKLLTAVYVYD